MDKSPILIKINLVPTYPKWHKSGKLETRLGKSMNQRVYAIRLHFVDTLYVNGEIYVTTTISFISEALRLDGYVDKKVLWLVNSRLNNI